MNDRLKYNLLAEWFTEMDAIQETDSQLKEVFVQMVTILNYPKKAIPDCSNAICILLTGLARSFYMYTEKDITSGFISKKERLHTTKNYDDTIETIEFLEHSKVASISLPAFEYLCRVIPAFDRFMRTITEQQLHIAERRSVILRIAQPEKRFELFMGLHPDIAARIPDSYAASYLGLNRSTLNKVKTRYYKR